MGKKTFIEKMAGQLEKIPSEVDIIALRQFSLDEIERRARRFLALTSETFNLPLDPGDRVVREGRTLLRLPRNSRAVIYHASGAMKLVTNLNPMEALFRKIEEKEKLIKMVETTARRLKIHDWIEGRKEALQFERLWQIKAAAADRDGNMAPPVLCRIIGAYRHQVGELPVWGPASVAIKLAGEGQLDSLSIQFRETTTEVVDRAKTISPVQGAEAIIRQLNSVYGDSQLPLDEVFNLNWIRFGYLSLPKRKVQKVLAPVFMAAFETKKQEDAQAYLFAAPATVRSYLPLTIAPMEAPLALEAR